MRLYLTLFGLAVAGFVAAFALTKLITVPPVPPPGMIWAPSGEFIMGTSADLGWIDEIPW